MLWGWHLRLPERKRIPTALLLERNTPQLLPAGAPPAGTEALRRFPGLPTPCHRCTHSRGPAGVPPQFASRSRHGAGPLGTAEAAADAPLSFPPGDLGEGRGRCRTGGTSLPLAPSPPALSLRLHLLCGARSVGPRSGPLSAPLTATMPPSALRSAVTLPRPPAAPHATVAR